MALLTYTSLLGIGGYIAAATLPPLNCNKVNIESTIQAASSVAAAKIYSLGIAAAPEFLTVTVINNQSEPISTSHAQDPGGPSAVSGNIGSGTMAASATAAFAVPTGWIGNIAINDAKWAITGDDSLIEVNFVIPQGSSVAVADVDVSYV
jgi:hypothetical protein